MATATDPAGVVQFRTAGGRFREAIAPDQQAHRADSGVVLLAAIHEFDRVHAVGLFEAGALSPGDAAAILTTLDSLGDDVVGARQAAGGGIHSGEMLLVAALGDTGGRLALGRSSADLGAVALRRVVRDRLLAIGHALADLRATLLTAARDHTATVIPSYAQGRHAQATTVGHVLGGWAAALERDAERLDGALRRTDRSPAGAAIGTGSTFGVDRRRVADLLGFDGVCESTIDAVGAFDHIVETLSTLAILNGSIARFADDLLLWSGSDCRFVTFPDRFCGSSSLLAQARNPYAPQFVKGVAAAAAGALTNALVVDHGPTGLAVLDRHQLADQLVQLLGWTERDLRWWSGIVAGVEWHGGRGVAACLASFAGAADLAGLLVTAAGMDWRTAHQVVGTAARLLDERGLGATDIDVALLVEAERLRPDAAEASTTGRPPLDTCITDPDVAAALDVEAAVEAHDALGGPAAARVTDHLRRLESRLADDVRELHTRQERIAAAATRTDRAVANIIERTQP